MQQARRNHAKRYSIENFTVQHVTVADVDPVTGCQQLNVFILRCEHYNAVRSSFESKCCLNGRINLATFPDLPQELRNLMMNDNNFKSKIRAINRAFSFSSIGAYVDQNVNNNQHNAYCFRVNGVISHRIGAFLPHI